MSSNGFAGEQKLAGLDAAVVGDNSFPQVSNLLRRFANSQLQAQAQSASKFGLSPLSLRERLLAQHDLSGSNLTSAESRSSSDMSMPFDNDLQSLWEVAPHQQPSNQQPTPQQQQYEGSPLNPDNLRQLQFRQQLGAMAAALLPGRGCIPPSDSAGSGDSRPAPKRRWAECLAEANSLPTSSPNSPPGPSPPPAGDSHSPLMLENRKDDLDPSMQLPFGIGGGGDLGAAEVSRRKEVAPAENSTEWEPRVRRKRVKGTSAGSEEDLAVSDGDGVVRIKAKSMTERQRRDRISDALRRLRGAVNSHGDMATMLNEAVDLIQQQKKRVEDLEMQILQQRLRQQLAGGCRTLF